MTGARGRRIWLTKRECPRRQRPRVGCAVRPEFPSVTGSSAKPKRPFSRSLGIVTPASGTITRARHSLSSNLEGEDWMAVSSTSSRLSAAGGNRARPEKIDPSPYPGTRTAVIDPQRSSTTPGQGAFVPRVRILSSRSLGSSNPLMPATSARICRAPSFGQSSRTGDLN